MGLWFSIICWGVTIFCISSAYKDGKEKGKSQFFISMFNPVLVVFYLGAALSVVENGIGYAIISIVLMFLLLLFVIRVG